MSAARGEFYPSVRVMLDLGSRPLLTDLSPAEIIHNLSASTLRRGLAVNAFALLETYLESRLDELLSTLPSCQFGYNSFPEELQSLVSLNAAIGLATKIGHAPKDKRLSIAEIGLQKISKFSSTPPVYTSFGFSPRGSNVQGSDISSCLSALGVTKSWDKMATVASEIGSTRVNISVDFDNIARTRHNCAHNSRSSIPTADLHTHLECVTVIGMSFDIIASSVVTAICSSRKTTDLLSAFARSKRSFRFLDQQVDGRWVERAESGGRNIKIYPDEVAAKAGVLSRAGASDRFHIMRNAQRLPIELF